MKMLKKRNGRNCVTAKVKNDMWEDINNLLFDVKFKILISRFKLKTKEQDFGFVL